MQRPRGAARRGGFHGPRGDLHQHINPTGWQEDIEEYLDGNNAGIKRVLYNPDDQLIARVPFIDPPIYMAAWKVDIGAIPLYLIDTNLKENTPANRLISARLYTGDQERSGEEIVLGIGGSYILNILGITPSAIHLNEGHPGFCHPRTGKRASRPRIDV